MIILAAVSIISRAQFFGNPLLDSDEGFYLLVGDRMLHGALPYVDIWDRKPVGLFVLYAAMRLLGGDGVLAYQLAGTAAVAATALLIARIARDYSSDFGATAAGAAYPIWLSLGAAFGGQAELFFNLPVCAAAWLTIRGRDCQRAGALWRGGASAMLLMGLAIQIKYSAMFVGVFLGCCWILAAWRAGFRFAILPFACGWIVVALIPTCAAAGYYAWRGSLAPFVYANFVSFWQRSMPATNPLSQLARMALVLSPLLACIEPPSTIQRAASSGVRSYWFVLAWLAAAIAGLLLLGTYLDQFMLPIVPPASAVAGHFFGRRPRSKAIAVLAMAFAIGQAKLTMAQLSHGSRHQLETLAAHVDRRRCLFVYSGLATFYRVGRTCIPTRFAFPSLLSRQREAGSIGTDPVQEVERVMTTRPGTVIVRRPYGNDENWAARRRLFRALHDHYHLVLAEKLGWQTIWLYRLKDAPSKR